MSDNADPQWSRPPRFAQLTYSSSLRGYQVTDSCGELTSEETTALVSRIATQSDFAANVPEFPTDEQVAQLPSKLVYGLLEGHGTAHWHTAPAGRDESGRPGNVFAHVVLDRGQPAGDRRRAVELWRSPDWLRPFGAQQVAAARLGPSDGFRPGGAISREATLAFLLDPAHWRMDLLAVLLDAVHAAMGRGGYVVLGVEATDSAAAWIAAVSYFMSADRSRRFAWSLGERGASVEAAAGLGAHLVAVSRSDLAGLKTTDAVAVLDEHEDLSPGQWDGRAHRAQGGTVPATAWSHLASVLLTLAQDPVARLLAIDEVVQEAAAERVAIEWPLALVLAEDLDAFADAAAAAEAVLATSDPLALQGSPRLARRVTRLLNRQLGPTAADAWARLKALRPERTRTMLDEVAWSTYVGLAARDRDWLCQPDGVPHAAHPGLELNGRPDLFALFDEAVALLESTGAQCDPAGAARWTVRLSDFLTAHGLAGEVSGADSVLTRLRALTDRYVRDLVVVDADLCEDVGGVAEAAMASIVRPVVASAPELHHGPLGRRLTPDVLGWLYPGGLESLVSRVDGPDVPSALDMEFVVASLDDLEVSRATRDAARSLALRALGMPSAFAGPPGELIEALFGAEAVPVTDLLDCLRRDPSGIPAFRVADSLLAGRLGSAAHEELRVQAEALVDEDAIATARLLDVLDLCATVELPRWGARNASSMSAIARDIVGWSARTVTTAPRTTPTVVAHVRAAAIVTELESATRPGSDLDERLLAWLGANFVETETSLRLLGRWFALMHGDWPTVRPRLAALGYLSATSHGDFPRAELRSEAFIALAGPATQLDGPPSIVERLVAQQVDELSRQEFKDLAEGIKDLCWVELRKEFLPADCNSLMPSLEKYLDAWLRDVSARAGWFHGVSKQLRRKD